MIGGGSIDINWITRGKDTSIVPVINVTQSLGVGYSIDATLKFGATSYSGPVSDINKSMLQTRSDKGDYPTIWTSAGISAGGKIGATGGVTYLGNGRFLLNRQINVGAGLPAGKIPFNWSAGTSNTYIIKDFRK